MATLAACAVGIALADLTCEIARAELGWLFDVIIAHIWHALDVEMESIVASFRRLFERLWRVSLRVARIRRMPTDDNTIKTSLRLPRSVHAELQRAATAYGLTVNAEVIARLQHDPRDISAAKILKLVEERDLAVENGLRKQNDVLWSTLDRASGVLKRVSNAMARVSGEGDAAELKREVEFALELIGAIGVARPEK